MLLFFFFYLFFLLYFQPFLKCETLVRYKTFAIGKYFEKINSQLALEIAL